ncbi:MAG: putative transposase, partial [Bryobacterales bacterium]|nr:putative transposase [Bryobacterales bacterium]
SERNFGTWQGRLPQELRLAGISTLEEANRFLGEHYIDVFNRQFAVAPEQKASAFRRSGRPDLDWVFTMQTERMVAKDNTVAIGDECGRSRNLALAARWPVVPSRSMNTSTDACRCVMART